MDLPTDPALDPLADGTAASLTLVAEAPDRPTSVQTRPLAGGAASLDFGDLPIVDGVRLSLLATAASGRLSMRARRRTRSYRPDRACAADSTDGVADASTTSAPCFWARTMATSRA